MCIYYNMCDFYMYKNCLYIDILTYDVKPLFSFLNLLTKSQYIILQLTNFNLPYTIAPPSISVFTIPIII